MQHGGVSWTPFAAAAAAIPLLGVGAAPWLAAPAAAAMMALAATVGGRWTRARRTGRGAVDEVAGLRRALARRDEQLAATVHELRTPLASVITALELLRSGHADASDDTAQLTDVATLAARHLAFLVDDVLDEQALANGSLRLALGSFRVDELLAEGMRTLALQAEHRGILLRVSPVAADIAVRTDPRRFLQVLFNLVGNALKFSRRGDPIEVRTDAVPHRVRIQVIDHGPGVPSALQDRLFTPLGNEPGTASSVSGNGLGLFVCARIVQQMGGKIGYERSATGGSAFWFELPRARARESDELGHCADDGQLSMMRG